MQGCLSQRKAEREDGGHGTSSVGSECLVSTDHVVQEKSCGSPKALLAGGTFPHPEIHPFETTGEIRSIA